MKKFVQIAADSKWCAAAPGLKPLRLLHAPLLPKTTLTTGLGLSIRMSMLEYVRLLTCTSGYVPSNLLA